MWTVLSREYPEMKIIFYLLQLLSATLFHPASMLLCTSKWRQQPSYEREPVGTSACLCLGFKNVFLTNVLVAAVQAATI